MSFRTLTPTRAPMASHVYTAAVDTTHDVYVVPSECKGRDCLFRARAQAIYVLFGTAATVEVDAAGVSTAADGVLTPAATSGLYVAADEMVRIHVPSTATHFAVEAAASTGYWTLIPAGEMNA